MRRSVRRDMFRPGKSVDLPAPEREEVAARLEELGLLEVERYEVVRCVNPLDHDQKYLKDNTCPGRIRIRPELDEDDHAYQCPDCGRTVFPSKKQRSEMMRTRPKPEGLRTWVRKLLGAVGVPVRESPVGLFRLEGPRGEVQVVLADVCADQSVFNPGYAQRDRLVFLVGSERDLERWTRHGSRSFHLLDLVLGDAKNALLRHVRGLLGPLGVEEPPAVYGLGGMPVRPTPPPPAPERFPGVARIEVPSGTSWGQIAIFEVDGDTVGVLVDGKSAGRFTFIELGMATKRGKKRTKKWELLMSLCRANGLVPVPRTVSWNAFKNQVSELRPLLQHIFGIDADPLVVTRREGLRSLFQALPEDPAETVYVGDVYDSSRQI